MPSITPAPRQKLGLRDVLPVAKKAVSDFIDDNAMSLAAGVAFYTALSLAPLLLLMLSVTSLVGQDLQNSLVVELSRLLGPQVGDTIKTIIEAADDQPATGVLSSIISIVTLLVSATGVFAELQASLNHIWDVETKPDQALKMVVRARLLSLGLVVSLGFLLLVSMMASAALSTVANLLGRGDEAVSLLWRAADIGLSLVLFGAMFAVMFKLLPDVRIRWRNVAGGALITAALFVVGKLLIGLYIGHSTVASSYGAAGSLIAMLVWVYYSAIIVFLGAEITQAWAERRGEAIEPSPHARRVAHHTEEEAKGAGPSDGVPESPAVAREVGAPAGAPLMLPRPAPVMAPVLPPAAETPRARFYRGVGERLKRMAQAVASAKDVGPRSVTLARPAKKNIN